MRSIEVPFRSRQGLRVARPYNPLSLGALSVPAGCPTRPLWWLLAAAAAGAAAGYAMGGKKKKGR